MEKKTKIIIACFALFDILFHLLFYNNLEYHRDELLYLSFGYHPDFGYASVPPLLGWITWLMNHTLGNSLFVVRLIPALFGATLVWLVSLIVKELGGKNYAQVLAAIALILTPVTLRTYFTLMPVFLDLFFWTLIFYLVIKYINTENENILIYLGAIAGLSLMNKYLIALLFTGLLLTILFTPFRNIFTKKKLYVGFLLGFLIFLPNIIWQLTHDIPATGHLAELKASQLVHVSRINFLLEQLLNPFAATLLTVPGLLYLIFNKSQRKYRFTGFTVIFVVIVLCILRGKSYYAQGIFPLLIGAGAVYYERSIKGKVFKIILPCIVVFLSLSILPFGLPVWKAPGLVQYFKFLKDEYHLDVGTRFEDESIHSLPQDYADMIGWVELASIVAKTYKQIDNKNEALIYCENYGQAGAINIIGKKYGLPKPVSFNESFIYWLPEINYEITSLIYIGGSLDGGIEKLFDSTAITGKISNPDAREYGTTVYLCKNPKSSFNEFFKRRVEDRTAHNRKILIGRLNQMNNLSKKKASWTSSVESDSYLPENAFDGKYKTRWSSGFSDPQWIIVDLGKKCDINKVILFWESAYATSYQIQVSADMRNWDKVYETSTGKGGIDSISLININARFIRMYGTQRATRYGYSLWEFFVW